MPRMPSEELGLATSKRATDLNQADFKRLHDEVLQKAVTPEHRKRASDAFGLYAGTEAGLCITDY